MKRTLNPEQLVKLAKDMKKQEEEDENMELGDLMVSFYLKPHKVCH